MLLHLLNLDALVVVLQCLDPCDLATLDIADDGVIFRDRGLTEEARFEYRARRVLTDVELAWFADRGVRVRLLQEYKENVYVHEEDGTTTMQMMRWYQNGQLHRDCDLPAAVLADGTLEWYQKGQRHRDGDLPAVDCFNGTQAWYQKGELHRDNGLPAVIYEDGEQGWYQNGKLHRGGDLPAIIRADGHQAWFQNGQEHRDGDLPAVVYADGRHDWYQNGERHRDGDLPAIVWANGTQEWYQDGQTVFWFACHPITISSVRKVSRVLCMLAVSAGLFVCLGRVHRN